MYPNVRMLLGGNLPFMMDLPEAVIGDSESGCFFLSDGFLILLLHHNFEGGVRAKKPERDVSKTRTCGRIGHRWQKFFFLNKKLPDLQL